MRYLVVDAGYNEGKDRNILFATNDRRKAVTVAKESGSGVSVIEKNEDNEGEKVIFISEYKSGLELPV